MTNRHKSYSKILRLSFPPERADNPIMSHLVRKFDLNFSILAGQITPRREGYLTIAIEGSEENWRKAKEFLDGQGITVESAAQHIRRDEDSCMHCGICTTLCPAEALTNDLNTRKVDFNADNCTACGLCTKVCPVGAMQVDIENTLI